jgi:glycosyltransferase involved in cell wall biosynthesis
MIELARSPERRSEYGAAGRERVLAHFTWARAAAQVAAIDEAAGRAAFETAA